MKLKLDENLGHRTLTILQSAGYDVSTVSQQNISGISDRDLIDLCCKLYVLSDLLNLGNLPIN